MARLYVILAFLLYSCSNFFKKMNPADFFEGKYLELAKAIQKDDVSDIRLYSRGINLNQFGKTDMSLLSWAIINDKEDAVKELLRLGADPNLIDSREMQPIGLVSAMSNDNKYLKILLDNGGNPNSKYDKYKYALIETCFRKYWVNMDMLLKYGADINLKTEDGSTILLICTRLHFFDKAIELIKKGADLHINNDEIAFYVQEEEITDTQLLQQQIILKKMLIERGVVFPHNRLYEAKYTFLRKSWYNNTIDGRKWEDKLLKIANEPSGIGKIWVDAKNEENKAFKAWMLTNNIPEPPQIEELKKYE